MIHHDFYLDCAHAYFIYARAPRGDPSIDLSIDQYSTDQINYNLLQAIGLFPETFLKDVALCNFDKLSTNMRWVFGLTEHCNRYVTSEMIECYLALDPTIVRYDNAIRQCNKYDIPHMPYIKWVAHRYFNGVRFDNSTATLITKRLLIRFHINANDYLSFYRETRWRNDVQNVMMYAMLAHRPDIASRIFINLIMPLPSYERPTLRVAIRTMGYQHEKHEAHRRNGSLCTPSTVNGIDYIRFNKVGEHEHIYGVKFYLDIYVSGCEMMRTIAILDADGKGSEITSVMCMTPASHMEYNQHYYQNRLPYN